MEIVLLIIVVIYLIYQVSFAIPSQIKKTDDNIDMLKLHFKEINIKLDQISKKLDSK